MFPQQSMMMFFLISIIFSILSFMFSSNLIMMKFSFIELNSSQYNLEIFIDWKLLSFISIVSFITANIMMYSESYMMDDINKKRFTMILSLFAFSMMWTVMTSTNMMSMLVGWDFLGLSSLMLIIHYQSLYVFNYGFLTFTLNRIGDICFIIAGGFMFNLGSWTLSFQQMNITLMFLIMAGFTKSAQIPFSSWLPKAMAAPTPVSALVHSSTLVTAGVILLIRINPFLQNKELSMYLMFISVLTMLLGSIAAMIDYDLKKIIAFSTLSQISFMMIILLMGSPNLAFFHLLTHALFKSLMFICAGTIIHHSLGEQDIRKINNLSNWLPLELTMMNISMLALMGFPFYSGFFSKDIMIEYMMNSNLNLFSIIILDISICLTAFYSSRLSIYLCWNNHMKLNLFNYITSMNEKIVMLMFSMFIIMSGSVISWIYLKKFFIENPLPMYLKLFGVWGSLMVMIMTFFFIKYMNFNNLFLLNLINSMNYLNLMFEYLILISMYISIKYTNLLENIWNKFFSINMINNLKMIFNNKLKFSPLPFMKNLLIILIIIITII
uniref:NADH:ubiquinone reductase (H(+)-translocating) n=1 Tax=Auplopus sp. SJW-2017 TaxID=1940101 RepID=A0A1P8VH96_9HYME|nr:NADH dehydrogenase subunit 5 [Auplopus sp. SJW-2017]